MAASFSMVASVTGYATIIYLLALLATFAKLQLTPSTLFRYNHPSKTSSGTRNAWALVTGSSDGIGKAFAEELAVRKFNVILHGRNEKKLKGVQAMLETRYNVAVKVLVMDATSCFSDGYEKGFDETVSGSLQGINLTVLVNNLGGLGWIKPEWLAAAQRSARETDSILDVNLRFMSQLTRAVLPRLIDNTPSLILNISSSTEVVPAPYLATYSATKAYVSAFSRSLSTEMKMEGHDVEVMALVVGRVVTPGAGREDNEASFMIPTARNLARSSLNKVGCGSSKIVPYMPHALELGFVNMLPESWLEKFSIPIFRAEKDKMDKQH